MFIGVAIFNSFNLVPKNIVDILLQIDTILLTMAMAALGVTTHIQAIKQAGSKPLFLGLLLMVWLVVAGGNVTAIRLGVKLYSCTIQHIQKKGYCSPFLYVTNMKYKMIILLISLFYYRNFLRYLR